MFTNGKTAIDASVGRLATVGGAGDATVDVVVSLARWKFQKMPPPKRNSSVRIASSLRVTCRSPRSPCCRS